MFVHTQISNIIRWRWGAAAAGRRRRGRRARRRRADLHDGRPTCVVGDRKAAPPRVARKDRLLSRTAPPLFPPSLRLSFGVVRVVEAPLHRLAGVGHGVRAAVRIQLEGWFGVGESVDVLCGRG